MPTRIPLPSADYDPFNDVFDYFYKLKQAKTQREQFNQQLDTQKEQFGQKLNTQKEQFEKNYGLAKQAQDRANSLLPYMAQQYKDKHKRDASEADIKEIYSNLFKDALNSSGNPQSSPKQASPQAIEHLNKFLVQNPNLPPDQKSQVEQFIQYQQGSVNPNPSVGLTQGQEGQMPGMGQNQSEQIKQETIPQSQDQTIPGKEYEIRPGNPRLSKLDQVAGIVPGIPKPEVHYQNGMVMTRYPSGRMTIQNMSNIPGMKTVAQETPEQRQKREIQTRIGAATGIENQKASSKLQSLGRDIVSVANRALKLKKLIEENPGMTGWIPGGLASLNLSQNEKLAEFDQTARKLQADMARYGSQRGGAQALRWAERSKPGTYRQGKYDRGMIKSIYDDAKNDYDEMADEYKQRTGKEYPVKFPELNFSDHETSNDTEKPKKVTKVWNFVNGELK